MTEHNSKLQKYSWFDMRIRIEMASNGLRLEYTIEGSSNYIVWKYIMEVKLKDNGLK